MDIWQLRNFIDTRPRSTEEIYAHFRGLTGLAMAMLQELREKGDIVYVEGKWTAKKPLSDGPVAIP